TATCSICQQAGILLALSDRPLLPAVPHESDRICPGGAASMSNTHESDSQPPSGQVLIYQDGRLNLHVRLDGQSVWLTQAAIGELYQPTPQNITLHLQSIYDEGELTEAATCKEYLQVRTEGNRQVRRCLKHYSLDVILAVGYRVRSPRGTLFRQWATARLTELLVKGFTLDDERIKAGRTIGDDEQGDGQ
ncbi:MAG TPA: RhuM family protein, partial [Candidatus Anammoximicrobium sp.]|nr:RhuM family protein [Candidatus Anammoximicrobium sp.]